MGGDRFCIYVYRLSNTLFFGVFTSTPNSPFLYAQDSSMVPEVVFTNRSRRTLSVRTIPRVIRAMVGALLTLFAGMNKPFTLPTHVRSLPLIYRPKNGVYLWSELPFIHRYNSWSSKSNG